MEGSCLLPGITETLTARSVCVDTNPVFLSLRQGYSKETAKTVRRWEVKKNQNHPPIFPSFPSLYAPGFPFNTDLCRTLSHTLSATPMSNRFARLTTQMLQAYIRV